MRKLDKTNAYFYLKQHLNLKESISILDNERLGIDDYQKFKESEKIEKLHKSIIRTKNKKRSLNSLS
jgi:hypothetical protein